MNDTEGNYFMSWPELIMWSIMIIILGLIVLSSRTNLTYNDGPIIDTENITCIKNCHMQQHDNGLYVTRVAMDKNGCLCNFANSNWNTELDSKVRRYYEQ